MDRSQLKLAIETFQATGDYQQSFDILDIHQGRQPLMALQQALTHAETREERDALEDMGFLVSHPMSFSLPTQEVIDEIVQQATHLYGPYLSRFVDIPPLIVGMYRTSETPPPINSIIAVIGILAERAVASSCKVGPEQRGETIELFKNNCTTCGGTGSIYCRHCLRNARRRLEPMLTELMQRWSGSEDELVQQFLVSNSKDFGCRNCRQNPVGL